MADEIKHRDIHKALRNWVANELGIGRKEVEALIQSYVDGLFDMDGKMGHFLLNALIKANNVRTGRRSYQNQIDSMKVWMEKCVADAAKAVSAELQAAVTKEIKAQVKELLEERLDLSIHIRGEPRPRSKPRSDRNTEI